TRANHPDSTGWLQRIRTGEHFNKTCSRTSQTKRYKTALQLVTTHSRNQGKDYERYCLEITAGPERVASGPTPVAAARCGTEPRTLPLLQFDHLLPPPRPVRSL